MRMEKTALLRLTDVREYDHAGGAAMLAPRALSRDLEKVAEALRHGRIPSRRGVGLHPAAQDARAGVRSSRALRAIPRQHVRAWSRQRDEDRLAVPGRQVLTQPLCVIAQVDRDVSGAVAPLAAIALPERPSAVPTCGLGS